MENLLTFSQSSSPVHVDCELNLGKLYQTAREMEDFKKRYDCFLDSDADACLVYELDGDRLRYRSEHLIPSKKDDRIPLLLILGNPASHSITSGMFFSPRKNGKEHRFWEHLLKGAGIEGLSFDKGLSTRERNKMRIDCLMNGGYKSAFRIGLCVYISMPSSARAGVGAIRKLLGKQAFDQVVKEESERVSNEAANFLLPNGIGVTFQKDAWNGLSSRGNYTLEQAKAGKLESSFKLLPEISIFGVPPTRLLGASRKALQEILKNRNLNPERREA
jgi:hypothetical protein